MLVLVIKPSVMIKCYYRGLLLWQYVWSSDCQQQKYCEILTIKDFAIEISQSSICIQGEPCKLIILRQLK